MESTKKIKASEQFQKDIHYIRKQMELKKAEEKRANSPYVADRSLAQKELLKGGPHEADWKKVEAQESPPLVRGPKLLDIF